MENVVTTLRGPASYDTWCQQLRAYAMTKDVLGLILGTEKLLQKPSRPQRPGLAQARARAAGSGLYTDEVEA